MLCGSLDGRGVWGKMDTSIRMAESLRCPLQTITTLLTGDVLCLVAQLWPILCSPPGSSVHGDSPDKNAGVGCHFFLQVTFLMQGLNLCLQHCREILYHWASREARVVTNHHNLLLTSRYFLFRCWNIFINSSFYCIYHIHVSELLASPHIIKKSDWEKKTFSSKPPPVTENQAVKNSNNFMQVM